MSIIIDQSINNDISRRYPVVLSHLITRTGFENALRY